ncbi:sulfotransferase [Flagellimonas marinaquae]
MKRSLKIRAKRTFLEKKIVLHYLLYGRYQSKIFCIGFNKTGTTSLYQALWREGFKLGDQTKGERLLSNYLDGDFDAIVRYCRSARAFQDVPFSMPNTYRYLYQAFPNAKFILSVRDSGYKWYESQLRFAEKRLGKVPSLTDLKQWDYCWKGWSYQYHQAVFGRGVSFEDKRVKIKIYHQHIADIKEFFLDKPGQLLVLNVAEEKSFSAFCKFLGIQSKYKSFPWAKKT